MQSRYLKATGIGILAGFALLILNLVFMVLGFVGGLVIPFFSCALSCAGWLFTIAFMIGVGWYTASYLWAARDSDAVRLGAVAGFWAGLVSQLLSLLLGLLFSLVATGAGAVLGYTALRGENPFIGAFLGGLGGLLLGLLIVIVQFLFWVVLSVICSAIGGMMYSRSTEKQ